jgi:phage terminase large subunit
MERIKALERATEMTVKKMIKEERGQKPKYVERVNEKLHKIIIKNRITNTINELSQYRYTHGLEINIKDTESITIDKETLDITMT